MDEATRTAFEEAVYAAFEAGATILELQESLHYCAGRRVDA